VRLPRSPIERLRGRLTGIERALGETREYVTWVQAAVAEVGSAVRSLSTEVAGLSAELAERDARVLEILRLSLDREPVQRQALRRARESPSYELAYSDPEPLVSVVIPTWQNYEALAQRSLPSVLSQTHQNFEVIVVGDRAPGGAEDVVRSFGDHRIRYVNLERRGPYPEDPAAAYLVAGVPPYNEGVALARGRWIAPLDDDDAFREHHIAALLELARREQAELSYGQFLWHHRDRDDERMGVFPPEFGKFEMQGALYHADLRFFELELSDALFGLPGDWAWCQRLLRAGVRCAMLDEVVVDYYPSAEWSASGVRS